MNDESEYPRLTPPDDRLPSRDRLLRRPEELPDGQFDLLAAAWSEEVLSGDHLSELEAAMTADPSRRRRAESFRRVRLVPYDDRWAGRNRMLKSMPATVAIKRTLLITAAAAAVMTLIIFSPAVRRQETTTTTNVPANTTAMAEALIPAALPVIAGKAGKNENAETSGLIHGREIAEATANLPGREIAEATTNLHGREIKQAQDLIPGREIAQVPDLITGREIAEASGLVADREIAEASDLINIDPGRAAAMPLLIADADLRRLQPADMKPAIITSRQAPGSAEMSTAGKESNWILRGFSALVKAVTKEDKKIDGYFVASACVTGINNLLGWEMELKQTGDARGEIRAVNFSSSLLSFSAPVKKNAP